MSSSIPKIIHQMWKTETIPPQWERLRETWRHLNPQWRYRLWTHRDSAAFVAEHYAWFLPVFEGYDQDIKRADAARYFIMHHFGGVYVDLDFEALRPLEGLLAGQRLVLGWEPQEHVDREPGVQSRGLTRILGNAFLASEPRHPFWEAVFEGLARYREQSAVLDATGPFLLTRVYQHYPHQSELTVAPSQALYPVTKWDAWNGALDPDNARAYLPEGAYAVHHWNGSYRRETLIDLVRRHLGRET